MKKYIIFLLFIITAFVSCGGTLLEEDPAEKETVITISEIACDVSGDSATLFWVTNIPATHQIEYGIISGAYTATTEESDSETLSHTVTITDLNASTDYYFRIISNSVDTDEAVSEESTFTTSSIVMSEVTTSITATSVTLSWSTNIACTHQIEYGGSAGDYTLSTTQTSSALTSHSETILNLSTGATYHYRIINYAVGSPNSTSGDFTFTTDLSDITLSSVIESGITTSEATLSWTTNVPTTHAVEYGTVSGVYLFSTVESGTPGTSHTVNLTGLTEGIDYFYRVKNYHSTYGNVTSAQDSFTTVALTHPTLEEKLRGIWIIGGASTYAGVPFYTQIDLYDPVEATWYPDVAAAATGDIPPGLAFPMVESVNGKIYVMGGAINATTTSSAVYEYNIANNSWTSKAPIYFPSSVALMDAAAYTHRGKIYLMGGTTGVTTAGVVLTHHEYDPVNNVWTTVAPFRLAIPAGRCGMAVYNDNGLVSYALGRIVGGAPQTTNDIYMYNQNVYTSANPNITEQVFTAAFGAAYAGYSGTNGTYFFIIGGATNTITTYFGMVTAPAYIAGANSWQVYTPPASANGRFVAISNTYWHPAWLGTNTGLVFASAVVSPYESGSSAINPTLYVFGGIKNGSTVTDDYYYLSANGTVSGASYIVTTPWTGDDGGTTKMSRARYGHRAIIINQ